ncbi:hypothetical protein [Comamonas odontotermitis]|uniref:hypothetical protein n=1 Tax=Comamonas odontotermitis TaxID=379895 RepID=UPI001CC492F6|nr:hypothetical protein [Comamonas odontotermitis]UBB18552.1 hypothetical protein LAD35_07925 [Comamonas odontotermitis]
MAFAQSISTVDCNQDIFGSAQCSTFRSSLVSSSTGGLDFGAFSRGQQEAQQRAVQNQQYMQMHQQQELIQRQQQLNNQQKRQNRSKQDMTGSNNNGLDSYIATLPADQRGVLIARKILDGVPMCLYIPEDEHTPHFAINGRVSPILTINVDSSDQCHSMIIFNKSGRAD